MTLPNFLLIGAAKSGTTSLYRYLEQHPQIYANAKEPSYFAFAGQRVTFAGPGDEAGFVRRMVTDLREYEALFDGVTTEKVYGEASVIYLYQPQASLRIKQCIPGVKLIAILRHPVERAFSSYLHLRRDGREPLTNFMAALQAEEARIKANWEHQWHYANLGFYYTQLKRYYDLFPAEQIAVYLYDDLQQQPDGLGRDIFRFLEVDEEFRLDMSVKYNVSGKPKSGRLHTFLIQPNWIKDMVRPLLPRFMRRRMGLQIKQWNVETVKPELPEEARQYLFNLYRDEIVRLQTLIDRDLSHWLNGAAH